MFLSVRRSGIFAGNDIWKGGTAGVWGGVGPEVQAFAKVVFHLGLGRAVDERIEMFRVLEDGFIEFERLSRDAWDVIEPVHDGCALE